MQNSITKVFIWCPDREQSAPLTCCIKCQRYPCSDLSYEYVKALETSPFIKHVLQDVPFISRRIPMTYVLRHKETGEYRDPPKYFDISDVSKLTSEEIADIEQYEILCISKVLIPQVKLILRPKEEREAIQEQLQQPPQQQQDAQKKHKRRRG